MNVEIGAIRFRKIVGCDVALETLGTGFQYQGPIWHPSEHHHLQ